jgi:hypothetical protein
MRAKLGAKRHNGIIACNLGQALSPLSTGNRGNQVDKSMSYGVVAILIMLHPSYVNQAGHLNTFKVTVPCFSHQSKFALVRVGRH